MLHSRFHTTLQLREVSGYRDKALRQLDKNQAAVATMRFAQKSSPP